MVQVKIQKPNMEMKRIIGTDKMKRMVKWFLPFYLFTFLPISAQAQEVRVIVNNKYDPMPPAAMSYADDPGRFFTVTLQNMTDRTLKVFLGIELEKSGDNRVSLQTPVKNSPSKGVDLLPNSVKTLMSSELKQLFYYMKLSDVSIHGAIMSDFTVDKSEVEVGGSVTFTTTVLNQGTDVLPAVNISIYAAREVFPLATVRTTGAIGVGQSNTLSRKVWLSNVGSQEFYAVVNESEEVGELRYTNNESAKTTVKVLSPWTATLTTDKQVYTQQEKVIISGQLTGHNTANTPVDIYFINDGSRQVETVATDADGKFIPSPSSSPRPTSSQQQR